MAKSERDYLIDVAARHRYRNQTEKYQQKYLEWRTDPKNVYGYNFVHDSRLHTYVDGEGFLEETPVESEKTALAHCFRVSGFTMLIMAAVAFVRYLVMLTVFNLPGGGRTYYSSLGTGISDTAAYAILTLNLLEYVLPIIFLKAATRMPWQIAVPRRKKSNRLMGNAIIMMLVITVIGRVINSVLAHLLLRAGIDIPYYDYIDASSTTALVICGIVQHIIISVLIEIIFRGYLLQLFRQFSDQFAIIMTSTLSVFMLYDITQAGYLFCVGVFTGIVTIRSGSIRNACLMRIVARIMTYLITIFSTMLGQSGRSVMELVVCTVVLFGAVMVYMRLVSNKKWSFEISSQGSSMSTSEKFRLMISSISVWVWLIASFFMSMLLVRIL